MKMKYRNLGRSNLQVSCLALGGNILGHFCNRQETATIIDAARNLGINLIDTADVYSEGLSEEFIGASIRNCRDHWIIGTKVGVRSGEAPGKKGRKEYILCRVEESLRRLSTDYIDLYQMHHFDPETPLEETLDALHLLVQQGKVRYIGASNYSGEQLRHSLQLAHTLDLTSFSSTQNQYNLFKRDTESDVFPVCKEARVGVIVYGALARGVLSGKYCSGQGLPLGSRASISASIRADLTETVLQTVENLTIFAERRGKTVGNLALAWALRSTQVATLVVGVRNVAQLQANVGAVNWELSESELVEIDRIVGDLERFRSVSLGSSPTWS